MLRRRAGEGGRLGGTLALSSPALSERPDVSLFTPDKKLIEFGEFWYVVFGMSFGTQDRIVIAISSRVYGGVPKRAEPVEKSRRRSDQWSKNTPKHYRNVKKPAFPAPERRSEKGTKEFFNTLEGFWYKDIVRLVCMRASH